MNSDHFWGIVLAGGEGARLKDFVHSHFNSECPKQYCTFIGTRSMLRHTIDRIESLIAPDRLLTVISQEHLAYAKEQLRDRAPATVVVQPSLRDTAPGILYPLLRLDSLDPDATVAIFPSDHFVLEEDRFMQYVRYAGEFVSAFPRSLLLLGVEPNHPGEDYGWIEIDQINKERGWQNIHAALNFVEKPAPGDEAVLLNRRSLWNTMVCVCRVSVLLNHFRTFTPDIYKAFQGIRRCLDTPEEQTEAKKAYAAIPSINFSHAILEQNPPGLCVLKMSHVHWSDWGQPVRILTDLERFAKERTSRSSARRPAAKPQIRGTDLAPAWAKSTTEPEQVQTSVVQ